MKVRGLTALLLLSILAAASPLLADTPPDPPAMNVPRTTAAITLDGNLDDSGWQNAAVIDKFYETSPSDNIPAKIRTVAYLTYDSRYFYIGIRADDPQPHKIRAPYVDRDAVIGTDDNIAIFLDTRNDKRTAYELRVNPRGIQGDGIFNDANGSEDFSPDFFYDTAAKIDATGWSAEFRIPFSSLRYSSADPQTWNVLVWRNYPREFRYAFHSAPIARGSNCLVCHTHPITGLTQLPEASHLITAPYVTAQTLATPERGLGSPLQRGDLDTDAGVDVKWTPTQTMAVDLTVNPDFSQIEADVPQITVNERFAVFFPEKRPFFLEGFDLFDTPLQVTYTRNIVAPRFGTRVTGKIGDTAYTILASQDRGGGFTIIPGTYGSDFAPLDFTSYATIGRLRHDIGSSFVGAVLTDREISGGGHNRVFGPDGQWRPSQSDSISAQLLFSDTKNPDRPDISPYWDGEGKTSHAFYASWFHQKRTHDWGVELREFGDDFRADLGFVPQVGYREAVASFGLRFFPEHSKLRFVRPSVVAIRDTDNDNNTIYQVLSLGVNGIGFKNLNFSFLVRPEEKVRAFAGGPLLSQTYSLFSVQFDPSRRIPRVGLNGRIGEQISFGTGEVGRGTSLNLTGTFRPIDRLDLQLLAARQWLNLDTTGRLFTADVQRIRAQYSFSNRSLVRVIGQYQKTAPVADFGGNFLGSILYSYKLNWQTVLFVGYGDNRVLVADPFENDQNHLFPTDRSLFFKVSYAFLK